MQRTRQESRQRERVQAKHRSAEAARLERVRLQNAERVRRFRERQRIAKAAQVEALIYEAEPSSCENT